MAQIPDKVVETITRYMTALKKNHVPIKEAILFGSYAKGNYNEYSDIDLLLVSDAFGGSRMEDRSKIREITLSISCDLEVFPYSCVDFVKGDPFLNEIIDSGVKVSDLRKQSANN